VACISCHATTYAGTSTLCASCHLTNYNATTNPSHVAAKFPTDCKTCHTVTAWAPSTFNHTTGTTFPLTGAHIGVTCISCHSKGYVGTLTTCVSCHLTNYNATTNPSHVTAKYSTDCLTCHTSTAWAPSTFNHNTSTAFPLAGGHIGVACISCHATTYAGTSTLCASCHLTNYNATTNPSHVTAKFSTDCKTCHTVTAWLPATFNHTTGTTFPIVGAHIGVSCISCHSKGYVGISTDCYSCHVTNYNATTNPVHAAAKFPTTCLSCHTQTGWTPSTYNHDTQYFPINSGKHKGAWTLCTECHTTATNYAVFNCLLCHEHAKASMDSAHKGRSGYVYNSTNCLSCHPRGTTN
jgi:NMD protein affecting ribosome stability and mRNA decay